MPSYTPDQPFAVVMPVYEDREASTRLFQTLSAQYGSQPYLVVVDDGSVRQPVQVEAIEAAGLKLSLIHI